MISINSGRCNSEKPHTHTNVLWEKSTKQIQLQSNRTRNIGEIKKLKITIFTYSDNFTIMLKWLFLNASYLIF